MEEQGTVYLVLTETGGRMVWNIIHPIPVGAMIDAADALGNLARRQVISPAPVPEMPEVPEDDA